MSFILDALKKSEGERQRQIGPSLADVPFSRQRNERPWWVIAVAALLVVNLGVLLVVLMRDGDAQPTPDAAIPAPPAQPHERAQASVPPPRDDSAPRHQPGRYNPQVHSLASEADNPEASGLPNPHLAAAAVVPDGPPMVRPIEAPSVAPVDGASLAGAPVEAGPAAAAAAAQASAENDELLPRMGDLVARGTPLPDLHLDIHVYSGNPAERFVFVNMRKYTEGQALSEGPKVERITPDGVVLDQNGLRFLLPRP